MFEIANLWAFILIPLPLIIFLLPPMSETLGSALSVPFFEGLKEKIHARLDDFNSKHFIWFSLIWLLLVIALSGPRFVGKPMPLSKESYNIMLVLDISGSMEFNDMMVQGRAVTRLTVVKYAARQFVKDRVGDKIGLILFGSRAYLQTPLTYDKNNILMRLDDATVGLAGNSTSIGDAIGLAIKRLQSVPSKGRVIILLTDGVNNSGVLVPLKAAELAKEEDIKIYTIGLGAEESADFTGLFANPADLDEETLKQVAQMTGGQYFRATDLDSLESIYQKINQLEKVSQEEAVVRPIHEYYPWPLVAAFILLCGWLLKQMLGHKNRFSL